MSEPRTYAPVVDGEAGTERVEMFQHRPDTTEALLDWTDGDRVVVNGGPVVLLPGNRPTAERLVGLGDYAVQAGKGFRVEHGDGLGQRYVPIDDDDTVTEPS